MKRRVHTATQLAQQPSRHITTTAAHARVRALSNTTASCSSANEGAQYRGRPVLSLQRNCGLPPPRCCHLSQSANKESVTRNKQPRPPAKTRAGNKTRGFGNITLVCYWCHLSARKPALDSIFCLWEDEQLRKLQGLFFSPRSCYCHLLHRI